MWIITTNGRGDARKFFNTQAPAEYFHMMIMSNHGKEIVKFKAKPGIFFEIIHSITAIFKIYDSGVESPLIESPDKGGSFEWHYAMQCKKHVRVRKVT